MNASPGASLGVTRAAAIVPMPLTAISSSATSLIGLTWLNHSTSARSESRTTIGQRSKRALNRPSRSYQREFHACESQCARLPATTRSATSGGTAPASCNSATSTSSIATSSRHGSRRLAMFQQTTRVATRPPPRTTPPDRTKQPAQPAQDGGATAGHPTTTTDGLHSMTGTAYVVNSRWQHAVGATEGSEFCA